MIVFNVPSKNQGNIMKKPPTWIVDSVRYRNQSVNSRSIFIGF
jgi:hypothetical protein